MRWLYKKLTYATKAKIFVANLRDGIQSKSAGFISLNTTTETLHLFKTKYFVKVRQLLVLSNYCQFSSCSNGQSFSGEERWAQQRKHQEPGT